MLRLTLVAALAVCICNATIAAENALFTELTETGVEVLPGVTVKVARPSLTDGLDRTAQKKVLQEIADAHPLDEFVRDSAVAPFSVKMESVTDASGKRIAQHVNVWFVIYGKLATLRDEKMLNQIAAGAKPSGDKLAPGLQQLSAEQLLPYRLAPSSASDREEQWGYVTAPLLDRVIVNGVAHGLATAGDESILSCSALDRRFTGDEKYANQWRSVERMDGGGTKLGEPHSYAGCGGYFKATILIEPAGGLLVEGHVVFHEPEDWFNGANQLRSKIPIAAQEQIRDFRRKLAAVERKNGPTNGK